MTQLELEREMAESGLRKYTEALHQAQESGTEDRLHYGQKIIAKNINQFEKQIKKYVAEQEDDRNKSNLYLYAGHVHPAVLALFTLSTVVACNTRNDSVAVMAIRIGQRVEKEVRWDATRGEDQRYHFNIMRFANGMIKSQPGYRVAKYLNSRDITKMEPWTREIKLSIGMALIGLLHAADIGFHVEQDDYKTAKKNRKAKLIVRIAEKGRPIAVDALGGVLEMDDLWPMIEPPAPWTADAVGGYHSNGVFPHHVGPFNVVRAQMREGDFESMPKVIMALNRCQAQAWRIEPTVLAAFNWVIAGDRMGDINGMLPVDTIGCRTVLKSHHAIANRLPGDFWIPHNLCWRGRFMAQPSFSFQGPDYCRGLMRFAAGTHVRRNGPKWISLHLANSYGDDKISMDDRFKWADSHQSLVTKVGRDPITHFDLWREADAPWQFLSACVEWVRYLDSGRSADFVSTLPVGMDGSSNAIQHGSAFLRDPIGASWVNMREVGTGQPPADLYRKVSEAVNEELNLRANCGDPLAKAWLDFGVTRKVCKRIVMTRGYAGSKYGCSDMIIEDTLSKTEHKFEREREAAVYLGQLVHEKSMEILQGLAGTMEFLQARMEGKLVQFTMPTGFVFRQDYRQKKSKKVVLRSLPQGAMELRINVDKPNIDKRKMKAGIAANFTHACDAAHLVEVTLAARVPLGLVHDSYSTTPGECENLYADVRAQFAELHKLDMLKHFRDQVAPDAALPQYGTYDLSEIERAPYAFL